MPDLRSGTSTATLEDFPLAGPSSGPPRPPPVHATPPSDDDGVQPSTDNEEQVDASPRRPAPRRPAAPDLEDALTRLTQTVERMAAIQQRPPEPGVDVNEDPDFNWASLRSPLETTFPLPSTGVVQRIAAGLFAKLQAGLLSGRDHHEARFVLDILSDWEDMDVELRTRVFQRLNVYAIVATHGWATAIAATTASTNSLQCVLPPGVQPVIQQARQQQPRQQQQRGGRRGNRIAQPAPLAPAPAPPAPAPAARGGRNRRRQ